MGFCDLRMSDKIKANASAKRHKCSWPMIDCVKCEKIDNDLFNSYLLLKGFVDGLSLIENPYEIASQGRSILRLSKDFSLKAEKWAKWEKTK